MNVYIYECIVSLHGKEPETCNALVYARSIADAITLLGHTQGVLMHETQPTMIFSQTTYVEPCVVLERRGHS